MLRRAVAWTLAAACAAALWPVPHASRAATTEASVRRVYPADYAPGPGAEIARDACTICHGVPLVAQQHKDSTGWEKTVDTMVKWGAPVEPAQRAALVRYLLAHYGPRP
jgi:hypothetical protein